MTTHNMNRCFSCGETRKKMSILLDKKKKINMLSVSANLRRTNIQSLIVIFSICNMVWFACHRQLVPNQQRDMYTQ